ncbi:hypothetical protein C361_00171 [Cryptococcus neoformans Tu259-1]|uniref:Putative tyrosine-protein phosphatase OCA1 n=1 Tax=Cryptococcus neoformans Tu259-1 TaxID=1230072 RepID=A0A854QIX4_CRYNE|nr:hypothetical protein C361_00171 [Cryptococcus neoformans var. grubii Tu259-1]
MEGRQRRHLHTPFPRRMVTPPKHLAIAAALPPHAHTLYRAALPAPANLPFLPRLPLATILLLCPAPLPADHHLCTWARQHAVRIEWVAADEMNEEKLGMGRAEVVHALKMILDPALYPLYIADVDGVSHTTLVVACLRKLQGWHMDSIIDEISRFEPNYQDLPLVPFINAFCAPASSSAGSSSASPTTDQFTLPPPPYPAWLWPCPPSAQPRPRPRDRSSSTPAATPISFNPLPFPHPLTARKHPTMRLVFPPLPPQSQPQLQPLSTPGQSQSPGQQQQTLLLNSPGPIAPILPSPAHSDISRMSSLRHQREKTIPHAQSPPPLPPLPPPAIPAKNDAQSPGPSVGPGAERINRGGAKSTNNGGGVSDRIGSGSPEEGVLGVAANIVNASLNGIASVLSSAGVTPPQAEEQANQAALETPKDDEREGERERERQSKNDLAKAATNSARSMNAFNMSREPTLSSSDVAESSTSGVTASADDVEDEDHLGESDDEEDEDDYDDEEEEEEEEEEDIRATSQYISALDLAGF